MTRAMALAMLTVTTLFIVADLASAQTPPRKPATPGRPIDVVVGGLFIGPTSFGDADANQTRPDGSPSPIFTTSNRVAPGFGAEVSLTFALTRRLAVEATGAWQRADFETEISADIEDADPFTSSIASSRFVVEGAALWQLRATGKTEMFLRGSGGWMRELVGNGALREDGLLGSAGFGIKHWWRERITGAKRRRIGWRVDGRVQIRQTGLTLGDDKIRFAPLVFGGFVFGF
jgi:hypothetical protein